MNHSHVDSSSWGDWLGTPSTYYVFEYNNHAPTGTVIINDTTPQQNQILTVTNSLADADGLGAISYSWLVNNTVVTTGNNYTVTANDIGKTISVTASYTDGWGQLETINSAPTATAVRPQVIVSNNDLITAENGETALFNVSLSTQPLRDVIITFTSSDTSEGVISNSKLTFTSSNWATTQTLTVTGQNDTLNDGNQPYIISAAISSNDVDYRQLIISPIVLTNNDDGRDVPQIIYGDVGGSINDILVGMDGNDKLYGLNRQDDLSGGLGNDTLYGGYDEDFLYGQDGNDYLWGEQDNDNLDGGNGNDTLDGGLGSDTMIGGAGNDTYYLGYDAADVITDNGLNIDTIIMPYQISKYTLPANIENGTITDGTKASNLTGNASNNNLTGNAGNNVLSGGTGRDSVFGGSGNDVLNGGAGNDQLKGDAGKDIFLFNTSLSLNVDKITDFKPVDDTIQLENAIFTKLTITGILTVNGFITGITALDNNDVIIYNKTTGGLFYDADGNGAGNPVQIATLGVNLTLTNADFVII